MELLQPHRQQWEAFQPIAQELNYHILHISSTIVYDTIRLLLCSHGTVLLQWALLKSGTRTPVKGARPSNPL